MGTYLFVHGAFHGGWCWSAVTERLRREGYDTVAIDLPRGGADRTPIAEITLQSVTDRVLATLDAAEEPVVLVAHSAGGLPASMAVEQRPDAIARAVFVTAALLRDGEAFLPAISERDPASWTLRDGALAADPDTGELSIGPGRHVELFYNTCTPQQVRAASAQLTEPIAVLPLTEPVRLTAERFGRVPISFVRTLRDHALTAEFQQSMADSWQVGDVHDLDTDHSPFLCAPDALSEILLDRS